MKKFLMWILRIKFPVPVVKVFWRNKLEPSEHYYTGLMALASHAPLMSLLVTLDDEAALAMNATNPKDDIAMARLQGETLAYSKILGRIAEAQVELQKLEQDLGGKVNIGEKETLEY